MWKQMLKRLGAHRAYLPLLVGLLVLTFVLTAVLAYSAQDADRRHREAAEAALRDYTELAAEAYSTRVVGSVVNSLGGVLMSMSRSGLLSASQPTAADLAAVPVDSLLCSCGVPDGIGTRVFFDVSPRSTVQSGRHLTVDELLELQEVITRADLAQISSAWAAAWIAINGDPGQERVFATIVESSPQSPPARIFAFELRSDAIAALAQHLFEGAPLLFAESGKLSNERLFGLTFSNTTGNPLTVGDHATYARFSSSRSLPEIAAGLSFTLALKRGAEDILIPGGMPRPRLPFLLMILGVIGLALIGAVFVLRREAELMRMRSDFVASVSHELRTPLAQIRMFTETLLLGRVRSDIERRRALEIIEQEARRLATLVENVLTFGRGSERRAKLTPQAASFTDEIHQIVDNFSSLRNAQNAELRLELQDEIVVPVDRDALRQILLNLIDNALKYGPAGQRITVGTALFGDTARLWVDDEGQGVPVAERERVFESFHRLQRDVNRAVTGSGIGLAVVRELARLHGGATWIEDAPGGGARVVAEFPGAYVRGAETADGWAVA